MKSAILLTAIPVAFCVALGEVRAQTSIAEVSGTISAANTVSQSQQGGAAGARAQQQARALPGAAPVQPVAQPPAPVIDRQFAGRYGNEAAERQARAAQAQQAYVAPVPGQPIVPGQPGLAVPQAVVIRPVAPKQVDPDQEERIINFQRQNAVSGNPSAQYDLGMRYLKGDGVEQDDKQAMEWLKLAAGSGNSRAEKHLEALQKKLAKKATKPDAEPAPASVPAPKEEKK
jgi:TPR repeat protein